MASANRCARADAFFRLCDWILGMGTGNGSGIASEKYQVLQELGRGGMGIVYLAEDRQLRRQVALKVLYDYLNRDQEFVERFQEEARSVSCLHHPNIVCIHGLESSSGQLAIDMEYVEGTSLGQLPAAPPHLVAAIARDVLGGLAACHHIGVVHRDIKPSNILLNVRGQAKITDFGLATAYATRMEQTFQGTTSSGFYMGTPRYMPLQAWEGAAPEPYWDLYSFGVVLHELLSGQTAFKGENPIAVMRKQLTEPLPPLQSICGSISAEVSDLVEALLDTSRKQTGLTCAEALELLKESPEYQALHTSDSVATVPMLPRPKRRPLRKGNRPPWKHVAYGALAATTLLVAVVAGIYGLQPARPAGDLPPASAPSAPTARPIPASGAVFYDGRTIGMDGGAVWMVETDAQGLPRQITGQSPLSVWVIDQIGPPANGIMEVTGHWAARDSEESPVSRSGVLEGRLMWEPERDQPVLTLSRRRDIDLVEAPMTAVGYRRNDDFGPTDFLRKLEGNDNVMSFLYAELLGKRLPWAEALERRLPALPGARVVVPWLADPIEVNGTLDEATWTRGAFDETGRIGELAPRAGQPGDSLMVRWGEEAVYITARCNVSGATFQLGVAPGVERLPTQSGRTHIEVRPDGLVTGDYYMGGTQQPWLNDWHQAIITDEKGTRVEVAIPIATLHESVHPEPGRRWRINARFTTPSGGSEEVVWGAEQLRELEHGVLLVFQNNAE